MRKAVRFRFIYLIFLMVFPAFASANHSTPKKNPSHLKVHQREKLDAHLKAEIAAEEKAVAREIAEKGRYSAAPSIHLERSGQIILVTKNQSAYHSFLLKMPPRFILDLKSLLQFLIYKLLL